MIAREGATATQESPAEGVWNGRSIPEFPKLVNRHVTASGAYIALYVCAPRTRATSLLPRPIRGGFWLLHGRPRPVSAGLPLAQPKKLDGFSFGELPQFGIARHQERVLLPGRSHRERVRVRNRIAAFQASRTQDQLSIGEERLNRHHRELDKEPLGGCGPVALGDQVENFADVNQRDTHLRRAARRPL